ncbi:MAG: 16S rRNA (cytosine(967)-C(5))-methyltransferase RsmB [Clostridiales bacterium]|jgi:16S rRNA (cytosine967-C5)-methyltransferase|nr:16S rRNA (cytosine(967)-C(5))-methyltransferase RsmB [Clostridiales bacterium]
MDLKNFTIAHKILCSVYKEKAYSNIALHAHLQVYKDCDSSAITHLVYGVLQKDIVLQYIISQLVQKSPKQSVSIILKMGIFCLRFSDMPDFACINGCVELANKIHKGGVTGFVNALLRKSQTVDLPKLTDNIDSLSVHFCYPKWIVQLLMDDYGLDFAKQYMSYQSMHYTHIRHNAFKLTFEQLIQQISGNATSNLSALGAYVTGSQLKKLRHGDFAIQSLSSMLVIEALGRNQNNSVLDLCSAPGGKAIYYLQNNPNSTVLACDLHIHRLQLIQNYAKQMGLKCFEKHKKTDDCSKAKLEIQVNDAKVYNVDFVDDFDIVLCDVPCSGLGLVHNKPDLILFAKLQSISELVKLQYDILCNASHYVKVGGRILYSTCTFVKAENEHIVKRFLMSNPNFELMKISNTFIQTDCDNFIKLFPHLDDTDAFFGAVLQKVSN